MKKRILFILLLVLTNTIAQDTVFLKDGTTIEGSIYGIHKVDVRINIAENDKNKTIKGKDIEKVTMMIDDKEVLFTFDTVPFVGEVLLGTLIEGDVTLYLAMKYVPKGSKDPNKIISFTYTKSGYIYMYYGKKQGEKNFFDFNYDGAVFNKFNKRVSKYLKKCKSVSKQVLEKKLKKEHIEDICTLYNACN